MNNGNDWNQSGGERDGQVPATAAGAGHPLADNAFDFGHYMETLKLVFERAKDTPILKAIVLLSSIWLAWGLLTGMAMTVAHFIGGNMASGLLGMVFGAMGLLMIPLYFVVMAIEAALYDPMQRNLFHNERELGGPMDVIKGTMSKFVPAILGVVALMFTVGVGMVLCVLPGLAAAFLFSQAPYLMIVHDRGLVDAFKESMSRAMAHWHVLVMGIALLFAVAFVVGICFAVTSVVLGILSSLFAPLGFLGQPIMQWVFSVIFAVVGFLVSMTSFGLIDELEMHGKIQRA